MSGEAPDAFELEPESPFEPRGKAYIWPTWISGLLSGDDHCQWKAWLRAHFRYEKRPDTRENSLTQWKAEHAAFVAERAAALKADGWTVTVEEANGFTYRGKAAIVGGKPDLVATRPGLLRVEDCKTGKEREEHYWQVCIYGFLLPYVSPTFENRAVSGAVIYRHRDRPVEAGELQAAAPLIVAQVRRTGGAEEPPRTPSAGECGRCDILRCPDRADTPPLEAEGDLF